MDTIKSLLKQGKTTEALAKFRTLSETDQENFFRDMVPPLFPPSLITVLFRKLHAGKTYEDFYKAWLPPLTEGQNLAHYFPCPTYVMNAQNREDPSDILSLGLMWIEDKNLNDVLESMGGTESQRHDGIAEVAEKVGSSLMYKLKDMTQLGS